MGWSKSVLKHNKDGGEERRGGRQGQVPSAKCFALVSGKTELH
jgi:hypothetical protein